MRVVLPRAVWVFIVGFVVLGIAWLVWREKRVELGAPDALENTTRTRSGLEASTTRDAGAVVPEPRRQVNGHVRDEAGDPLVGAMVRLFADAPIWLSDSSPKGCKTSPLTCHTQAAASEVLKRHADGTLAFPAPLATATSDADGGFHFDDAPADGFVFAWKGDRGTAEELQGTADVDLQLLEENLEHTTFRVQSDDGLGLPGATLTAINPFTGQSQRGVTDEQGALAVTLPGWLVWVAAEKAGLQMAFRLPASREALVLTAPRSVRVRLGAAEGPVDGTVTLNCGGHDEQRQTKNAEVTFDDVPSTSCWVQARTPTHLSVFERFLHPGGRVEKSLPLLPAAVLSLTLISGDDDGPVAGGRVTLNAPRFDSHTAMVSAGERITFPPIPAGAAALRVDVPGYAVHVVELTLPPGASHREEVLRRRMLVSGRVISSDGSPVSRASVAAFAPGHRRFIDRADTRDGGFSLQVEGPGTFRLLALHETEGVCESAITVPGPSAVLQLERRGVITVEARTGSGQRLTSNGTLEFLNPPDGYAFGTRWPLRWSDEGASRVSGLSPGNYRLSAVMFGWLPFERVISLAEGEQRREVVRLSAGESISGVVVDERGKPIGGADVSSGRTGALTQKDGTFVVRGLAPGPATVFALSDGRESAEQAITAPAAGLRLVLKEYPLHRGRVVDEAGTPAKAFVINGEDIRSDEGRFEVRLARNGVLVVSAFGRVHDFRKLPEGDVGDLVMKKPITLRGHVRHADGRNAVGVELITPAGERRTDGNGDFELTAVRDGTFSVVAMDTDGYAIMELRADRLTEATLQPLLDVSGQVVDGEGNGTPTRVDAKLQGVNAGRRSVSTTADGRFSLRVTPGVWLFEAEDGQMATATIERSGQFVKVAPGDGCSLGLLLPDDLAERLVTVSRGAERVASLRLQRYARLVLPCGRYQVSALAGDGSVWTAERELKRGSSDKALQVGAAPAEQ